MSLLARLLELIARPRPRPKPRPKPPGPPPTRPPAVPIFVPGGHDDDGNTPEGLAFALINQARLNERRDPLQWDARLESAAAKWAGVMELHGKLAHEIEPYPKLHERVYGAGYPAAYAEEVIALTGPDPKATVEAWLASGPHRASLLSPNARLIGLARSGDFWCGVIGY